MLCTETFSKNIWDYYESSLAQLFKVQNKLYNVRLDYFHSKIILMMIYISDKVPHTNSNLKHNHDQLDLTYDINIYICLGFISTSSQNNRFFIIILLII